jgi:DNA-binding helix-hairpin-helix protein with protein kinase domain
VALKKDLDALAAEREARIRACASPEPEPEQRARYLAGFRIEAAKLTNIGPARCAVLRSWGIDTAADVDEGRIADIPGFGKNLTDKLVIWCDMKQKAFVYNGIAIADPLEVQRIDRQLAARRTKLMKETRERISEVERRVGQFNSDRAALWTQVEMAFNARMLARLGA